MDLNCLAPLVLQLFFSIGVATHTAELFFARIRENNYEFISTSVIEVKKQSSVIECAVECLKMSNCASYNAKKEVDHQVRCDFLSDIPLSPETDLTPSPGVQYFEKTCQIPFKPTTVTEYEDNYNNGYFSDRVYVAADDGNNVYIVYLTPDHDVVNITFDTSVASKTGGSFQQIFGNAFVNFDMDHHLNVHILDSGIMCLNETSSGSQPCFSDLIVSKTSLFGTEDVNALLSTPDFKGLYAFGDSRITQVDIPMSGPWVINKTIDLSPGNRPLGWRNIPRGIVGAAWLVENIFGANIYIKAFLLTRYYYVVYDTKSDIVLKRKHLCPVPVI